MSAKRSTLRAQYRRVLSEVGDDAEALSPRYPPRAVTFDEAFALVSDLLDGDPDEAREGLAALLARALSGEAAHLEAVRRHVSSLPKTARITQATRDAIIRADHDLKRAGVTSKGERNERLAKRFRIRADTVRKITPQEPRGRPRKVSV
ncbi:hypothetical protein G3N95_36170 [Paraburkholderia sp. Tr-20389]|uniref:hypothetical protein n=1 Tax=Paraburkholderia sp. Tr-20389 TaxID=2703903 RepID=UPI00197F7B87|nr:hypothetical protein [Paraburkholderia sp. Tr-20389]MBN3758393.1 hypothetical protein [Paraburkholderia sp. Tr-20389]